MKHTLLAVVLLAASGCVTAGQLREAEDRVYRAIDEGDSDAAEEAASEITRLRQAQEAVEAAVREVAGSAGGMIPGVPEGLIEALLGLGLAYGTYTTTRRKVHRERDQKYLDAAKAAATKSDQA